MESSTSKSIRIGGVERAVALGLAVLVTSFIFTSVPLAFTAGAQTVTAEERLALIALTRPQPGI